MRLQRHAHKFLRAYALTPEAVDCPHTYDQLTKADLGNAVEPTVCEMLKVLGYKDKGIIFNYRDPQTIDAMLRLIGAQIGENLHDKEADIRRYLAENVAEYLKPGEDFNKKFNPESILNETVSEHVDQFQVLFDEIAHLPASGAESNRAHAMEMMAATEALMGARDLAKIYHIPLGPSPHPALAILEPHVARWEAKEAAAQAERRSSAAR